MSILRYTTEDREKWAGGEAQPKLSGFTKKARVLKL